MEAYLAEGQVFELGERFRIVDRGGPGGLYFEERSEDALGASKWDDAARYKGKTGTRVELPYGLVLELVRQWKASRGSVEAEAIDLRKLADVQNRSRQKRRRERVA